MQISLKFVSNKNPAKITDYCLGIRMERAAYMQKWVANDGEGNTVSFGGICSFKVAMKQGPMNLGHIKI